ncbi:DMT family transporter [Verrucomicrobium sp. BvORR106]|uniref:DMT family transporter n=1 Tax=Verrucomicrobium sp. BvORR106 TaxID=1403819 RepID=UPI00068FF8C5|nr:DMT family transporter [Verrucomicrobium sp. BvORR106]
MSSLPVTSSSPAASWASWLQLHLVVLAWGFTGPLGRLISLPPVETVAWRTGLAALGLAVLARIMKAGLNVGGRTALKLLGNGLLVGAHWMLFFLAVKLGNVSVAMAALPTTMIWCSLLEPLFEKGRRISRLELGMGLLMVLAVGLIFRVEFAYWQGFAAGLGCAFVGALFAVINKHLVAREHFAVISCYQMAGACAGALAVLAISGASGRPVAHPQNMDWVWLLVLSQVCTVGAYAAYMDVLRRLSVFSINVVYNLEPVYGILLAALFFGDTERMSPGFYVGTGMILVAVVVTPWLQARARSAGDARLEDTRRKT